MARGRAVGATVVPQAITDAQCELALAFLREDLTRDPATRGIRRDSKTVGPIGKTVETTVGHPSAGCPTRCWR
jgi:hypothetical protein